MNESVCLFDVFSCFSIVIPVLNEEDNIFSLVREIGKQLQGQRGFEVVVVDDHSTDKTAAVLAQLRKDFSWLRTIRLSMQSGQSAALWYGIWKARYPVIVTMDGDGQNDPMDIGKLLNVYQELSRKSSCCLVNGNRVKRKDSGWRRFSSLLANTIRRRLLQDDTPDSGCGIKAFSRETFLSLPSFSHMHRFLPALVRQKGGVVVSVAVRHRARTSGSSHYGTLDRLRAGILDLMGVSWLGKRAIGQGLIEEETNA